MRDRDLFSLRLERRDHAEDSSPPPLGALRVLLLCEISLSHDYNHGCGHRLLIRRYVSPRHDAVAFGEIRQRKVSGVGQRRLAGSEFLVGRLISKRNVDYRTSVGFYG